MTRIHPAILSGGSGTRLWPASRAHFPKQFLALTGDDTLLQATARRVATPDRFAPPLVICNNEHRFVVAEQLRAAAIEPSAIVLEPVARNTAPAAAVAALMVERTEPEGLMFLLPSDHHIVHPARFEAAVAAAARIAGTGRLVTFGIAPTGPETGYGYIERGAPLDGPDIAYRIARFTEKPDRETAERYLTDRRHDWNSGMFMVPVGSFLAELARWEPAVLDAARRALDGAERDLDFLRLDAGAFADAPSISIDYGVMERTDRGAVVPVPDMGWSDLGSWSALWQVAERDADDNATRGDVLAIESRGNYLQSDHGILAALGVEDLVVVATADAVLVAPRDRAQDLGVIARRLADDPDRSEHLHHRRVYRPWGSYESVDAAPRFQVKRIVVKPGARLSLQRHRHRNEHWVVVRGTAEVTCGTRTFRLEENQSTYIPAGEAHRLANPGEAPLHLIEVQSGAYLGEDDIERLDDLYGRAPSAK